MRALEIVSTAGPSFARGLWRIAAADVSSGNQVRLLHDGPITYDCMEQEIDRADATIDLESYIFRDDAVGRRFADALIRARGRNVRVRVLSDWIGSRTTPRAFWRRMRDAGAEVRIFNKLGFRKWLGLVPRDHRKVLVVDEAIGVTGGIGLGDEWADRLPQDRPSRWRDTAVRIEGPAATDMARAFDAMWLRSVGQERRDSARLRIRRDPRRHLVKAARGTEVDPSKDVGAIIGIIEGEPLRLRIGRALQIQAVSAERSIWIASAYFVPSVAELEALAGAARDGVDVRVLVPGKYDHPWVRLLARRLYRRMLMNGVRIWEWQGVMMHAKTSVIDGRWVRVGSTDFNPLGIAINYELDAVIEDRALGLAAEKMFLDDLTASKEILIPALAALGR